jgi:hypothetical protein
MGVDAYIYLPKDVRVHDVAKVAGILAGIKPEWEHSDSMHSFNDAKWAEVHKADAKGIECLPSCADIRFEAKKGELLVDGEFSHFCMFHYEISGRYSNYVLLSPRSTAFWIGIGIGLCKFFGGAMDFNDCDSGGINRRFPRQRKNNSPEDGKSWNDFQKAIMNVKALSKKDLEKAEKLASYKKEA